MTVDIKRMTAHLSQQQQDAITRAYKQQAENETAAFLWCFFLGWMGAHRFYLHQWGQGIVRLIVALIAIGVVIVGIIVNLDPTIIVVVALPFAMIALIWEIIDLFRIDEQISARNLKVAEVLIAESLLADTTGERQAQAELDEVVQNAVAQPASAGASQEVAEHYEGRTITQESDNPNATQHSEQPVQPGTHDWNTTEIVSPAAEAVTGAAVAGAAVAGGAQLVETVTQAHEEAGYSVTNSTDTVFTQETPQAKAVPDEVVTVDMTPMTAAEANATTWPDHPLLKEAALAAPVAAMMATEPTADATFVPTTPPVDVTDSGSLGDVPPVADVGTVDATPHFVALGNEAAVVAPLEDVSDAAPAPVAETASIPAESYIPPTVPVVDSASAAAVPAVPAEDLSELAGLAAGTAGVAEVAAVVAPVAEPTPAAAAEEPHHMLKRIRVTRQIKLNGEVIEETSAEALIDADADPGPVRQLLHDQLHQQAAARMAELGIADQASIE